MRSNASEVQGSPGGSAHCSLSADAAIAMTPAASGLMGKQQQCAAECVCICAGIRNWVAAKVISDQPGSPRSAKEDENLPKGESVTLFRSLKDAPRAVDKLLLAPRSPHVADHYVSHIQDSSPVLAASCCIVVLCFHAALICCIDMLLLVRCDMGIIASMLLESNLCLLSHVAFVQF